MKAREVKVFEYVINDNETKKVFKAYAKFHQFGTDFVELESGPGLYPVAIVEMSDGTVQNIQSELIQFVYGDEI